MIGSSSGGVNIEEMTDSIVTDAVDIDHGNCHMTSTLRNSKFPQ